MGNKIGSLIAFLNLDRWRSLPYHVYGKLEKVSHSKLKSRRRVGGSAMQRQTAVTAHLKNEQLLLFVFVVVYKGKQFN